MLRLHPSPQKKSFKISVAFSDKRFGFFCLFCLPYSCNIFISGQWWALFLFVFVGWGVQANMVSCRWQTTVSSKDFQLEAARSTYLHNALTKVCHMSMPNLKGMESAVSSGAWKEENYKSQVLLKLAHPELNKQCVYILFFKI